MATRKPGQVRAVRPKPTNDDGLVIVPPVSEMQMQIFIRHCQARHMDRLGFRTKTAHDVDHDMNQEHLDHVHRESDGDDS